MYIASVYVFVNMIKKLFEFVDPKTPTAPNSIILFQFIFHCFAFSWCLLMIRLTCLNEQVSVIVDMSSNRIRQNVASVG